MKPHTHAALMAQYAEDAADTEMPWERWEWKRQASDWLDMLGCPLWVPEYDYRRKPRTININGFEVPEPLREKPERQTSYWKPSFDDVEQPWEQHTWADDGLDDAWLSLGICHMTREAAELHAKALLSFTQQ